MATQLMLIMLWRNLKTAEYIALITEHILIWPPNVENKRTEQVDIRYRFAKDIYSI